MKEKAFSVEELHKIYKKELDLKGEDFFNPRNKHQKCTWIDSNGEKVIYEYKQILEAIYLCRMCLSIRKVNKRNFKIILSDKPDILLIDEDGNKKGFEVYEAYEYSKRGKREQIDVTEEVKKVREIKAHKEYEENTSLLIANRRESDQSGFNLSEYIDEINKYEWKFLKEIRLYLFNNQEHKFYRVFPSKNKEIRVL